MPIQPSKKARQAIAKDHLPRGPIARETQWRITSLGLTRAKAALLVKDAASQLSRLMTGHVHEFSADRLIGMLVGLGSDVEVIIRHPKGRKGRGKVRVRSVRK